MSNVLPSSWSVLSSFLDDDSVIADVLDLPNQLQLLYTNISSLFTKDDNDLPWIIPDYIIIILLCSFLLLFFKRIR